MFSCACTNARGSGTASPSPQVSVPSVFGPRSNCPLSACSKLYRTHTNAPSVAVSVSHASRPSCPAAGQFSGPDQPYCDSLTTACTRDSARLGLTTVAVPGGGPAAVHHPHQTTADARLSTRLVLLAADNAACLTSSQLYDIVHAIRRAAEDPEAGLQLPPAAVDRLIRELRRRRQLAALLDLPDSLLDVGHNRGLQGWNLPRDAPCAAAGRAAGGTSVANALETPSEAEVLAPPAAKTPAVQRRGQRRHDSSSTTATPVDVTAGVSTAVHLTLSAFPSHSTAGPNSGDGVDVVIRRSRPAAGVARSPGPPLAVAAAAVAELCGQRTPAHVDGAQPGREQPPLWSPAGEPETEAAAPSPNELRCVSHLPSPSPPPQQQEQQPGRVAGRLLFPSLAVRQPARRRPRRQQVTGEAGEADVDAGVGAPRQQEERQWARLGQQQRQRALKEEERDADIRRFFDELHCAARAGMPPQEALAALETCAVAGALPPRPTFEALLRTVRGAAAAQTPSLRRTLSPQQLSAMMSHGVNGGGGGRGGDPSPPSGVGRGALRLDRFARCRVSRGHRREAGNASVDAADAPPRHPPPLLPTRVVAVLHGLTRLGQRLSQPLWRELLSYLQPYLSYSTSPPLPLPPPYRSRRATGTAAAAVAGASRSLQHHQVAALTLYDLVDIATALAAAGCDPGTSFLQAHAAAVLGWVQQLTGRQAARLLWSYASLDYRPPAAVQIALAAVLRSQARDVEAGELALGTQALALMAAAEAAAASAAAADGGFAMAAGSGRRRRSSNATWAAGAAFSSSGASGRDGPTSYILDVAAVCLRHHCAICEEARQRGTAPGAGLGLADKASASGLLMEGSYGGGAEGDVDTQHSFLSWLLAAVAKLPRDTAAGRAAGPLDTFDAAGDQDPLGSCGGVRAPGGAAHRPLPPLPGPLRADQLAAVARLLCLPGVTCAPDAAWALSFLRQVPRLAAALRPVDLVPAVQAVCRLYGMYPELLQQGPAAAMTAKSTARAGQGGGGGSGSSGAALHVLVVVACSSLEYLSYGQVLALYGNVSTLAAEPGIYQQLGPRAVGAAVATRRSAKPPAAAADSEAVAAAATPDDAVLLNRAAAAIRLGAAALARAAADQGGGGSSNSHAAGAGVAQPQGDGYTDPARWLLVLLRGGEPPVKRLASDSGAPMLSAAAAAGPFGTGGGGSQLAASCRARAEGPPAEDGGRSGYTDSSAAAASASIDPVAPASPACATTAPSAAVTSSAATGAGDAPRSRVPSAAAASKPTASSAAVSSASAAGTASADATASTGQQAAGSAALTALRGAPPPRQLSAASLQTARSELPVLLAPPPRRPPPRSPIASASGDVAAPPAADAAAADADGATADTAVPATRVPGGIIGCDSISGEFAGAGGLGRGRGGAATAGAALQALIRVLRSCAEARVVLPVEQFEALQRTWRQQLQLQPPPLSQLHPKLPDGGNDDSGGAVAPSGVAANACAVADLLLAVAAAAPRQAAVRAVALLELAGALGAGGEESLRQLSSAQLAGCVQVVALAAGEGPGGGGGTAAASHEWRAAAARRAEALVATMEPLLGEVVRRVAPLPTSGQQPPGAAAVAMPPPCIAVVCRALSHLSYGPVWPARLRRQEAAVAAAVRAQLMAAPPPSTSSHASSQSSSTVGGAVAAAQLRRAVAAHLPPLVAAAAPLPPPAVRYGIWVLRHLGLQVGPIWLGRLATVAPRCLRWMHPRATADWLIACAARGHAPPRPAMRLAWLHLHYTRRALDWRDLFEVVWSAVRLGLRPPRSLLAAACETSAAAAARAAAAACATAAPAGVATGSGINADDGGGSSGEGGVEGPKAALKPQGQRQGRMVAAPMYGSPPPPAATGRDEALRVATITVRLLWAVQYDERYTPTPRATAALCRLLAAAWDGLAAGEQSAALWALARLPPLSASERAVCESGLCEVVAAHLMASEAVIGVRLAGERAPGRTASPTCGGRGDAATGGVPLAAGDLARVAWALTRLRQSLPQPLAERLCTRLAAAAAPTAPSEAMADATVSSDELVATEPAVATGASTSDTRPTNFTATMATATSADVAACGGGLRPKELTHALYAATRLALGPRPAAPAAATAASAALRPLLRSLLAIDPALLDARSLADVLGTLSRFRHALAPHHPRLCVRGSQGSESGDGCGGMDTDPTPEPTMELPQPEGFGWGVRKRRPQSPTQRAAAGPTADGDPWHDDPWVTIALARAGELFERSAARGLGDRPVPAWCALEALQAAAFLGAPVGKRLAAGAEALLSLHLPALPPAQLADVLACCAAQPQSLPAELAWEALQHLVRAEAQLADAAAAADWPALQPDELARAVLAAPQAVAPLLAPAHAELSSPRAAGGPRDRVDRAERGPPAPAPAGLEGNDATAATLPLGRERWLPPRLQRRRLLAAAVAELACRPGDPRVVAMSPDQLSMLAQGVVAAGAAPGGAWLRWVSGLMAGRLREASQHGLLRMCGALEVAEVWPGTAWAEGCLRQASKLVKARRMSRAAERRLQAALLRLRALDAAASASSSATSASAFPMAASAAAPPPPAASSVRHGGAAPPPGPEVRFAGTAAVAPATAADGGAGPATMRCDAAPEESSDLLVSAGSNGAGGGTGDRKSAISAMNEGLDALTGGPSPVLSQLPPLCDLPELLEAEGHRTMRRVYELHGAFAAATLAVVRPGNGGGSGVDSDGDNNLKGDDAVPTLGPDSKAHAAAGEPPTAAATELRSRRRRQGRPGTERGVAPGAFSRLLLVYRLAEARVDRVVALSLRAAALQSAFALHVLRSRRKEQPYLLQWQSLQLQPPSQEQEQGQACCTGPTFESSSAADGALSRVERATGVSAEVVGWGGGQLAAPGVQGQRQDKELGLSPLQLHLQLHARSGASLRVSPESFRPLVTYLQQLHQQPGMALQPLRPKAGSQQGESQRGRVRLHASTARRRLHEQDWQRSCTPFGSVGGWEDEGLGATRAPVVVGLDGGSRQGGDLLACLAHVRYCGLMHTFNSMYK